jgi:alcohol dehydrogenase class IV
LFKLPSLSRYGINEKEIPALGEQIFKFKAILDMNPVKIDTPDVISNLIRLAL